jgi:hypothetical protein
MEPEKRISDEDFINMYESKDREEGRLDKYVKDKESKPFNFAWWIFLAILFLVAYWLFSKYMFPPKI